MSSNGGRGRHTSRGTGLCRTGGRDGRIHSHRAHILALTSPDPARPLFGPASTIAYLPYRDDLPQSGAGFELGDGSYPELRSATSGL